MKPFFSQRHAEAIETKKLECSLAKPLRVSLLRVMDSHSGQSEFENYTFMSAEWTLQTAYGQDSLRAYNDRDELDTADFEGVVRKGWPPHALDCLEAWFAELSADKRGPAEVAINEVFELHKSPWRVLNGLVVLLDKGYLQDEVISRSTQLMRDSALHGPLEEFSQAWDKLTQGESKEAIVSAHKSLESVLKSVTGKENLRFGQLIRVAIDSGLIPEYYDGFLKNLEGLLVAVGSERNLAGRGHGQGSKPVEVPKVLGKLAMNLVATMNLFLLEHWQLKRASSNEEVGPPPDIDDLPF